MRFVTASVVVVTATFSFGCGPLRIAGSERSTEKGLTTTARAHAISGALRQLLDGRQPAYVTPDQEGARLWKQTRTFYERRAFACAWLDTDETLPSVDALLTTLRKAADDGLDPEIYSLGAVEQRTREASSTFLSNKHFDAAQAGALDVWLTYLEMKFASDLADGVSDLAHADPGWKIKPEPYDPLAELETALQENRLAQSLANLAPRDPEYLALRKALADHRALQGRGGWPSVPSDTRIKPGQPSNQVAAILRRLAASGDFHGAIPTGDGPAEYSVESQEAVKRFQRRHGLADDAAVGPAVVAEMNVPVVERIHQIELNMERWRWLPRELGDRHILVNIPEMRLDVRDHGDVPLTMRVVVGKQDTQTPIFSDEMTHIVFSPYWNVPADIAKNETIPSAMKDPDFLDRTDMEVVDSSGTAVDPSSVDLTDAGKYRFRQRPGASNSLGLVKFMFPNQFNVYLHDTPADSLFARASRSFSHGCVRLEQPDRLAHYVLKDQPEWTPGKIEAAMHSGQEQTVKLTGKLPVYLGYWTARVSADGSVQFRKDVYGIDRSQIVKVAERLQRQRTSAASAATLFKTAGKAAGQ